MRRQGHMVSVSGPVSIILPSNPPKIDDFMVKLWKLDLIRDPHAFSVSS